MAGADTRSGFGVPWDGTLGPGLAGPSSGWSGAVVSYQRRRRGVLVRLSVRGGRPGVSTLPRGRRAWGRDCSQPGS